jgi:hypothetical protein
VRSYSARITGTMDAATLNALLSVIVRIAEDEQHDRRDSPELG